MYLNGYALCADGQTWDEAIQRGFDGARKGTVMKRVTGIGGIFFKADQPDALRAWYKRHLGIPIEEHGATFMWREDEDPDRRGMTVWSIFARESTYFDPTSAPFMINYRVDDLDALLEQLRAEGVTIDPKREDYEYGRFAWIIDPAGNRIELWEPPKSESA
jgi:predicted enzyme related to lactoylglutathione lyase